MQCPIQSSWIQKHMLTEVNSEQHTIMWSFCEIFEIRLLFKSMVNCSLNKLEWKCISNINKNFVPAAYAHINYSDVGPVLPTATTEEINPVYEAGAFGDIQPYAEVRFYYLTLGYMQSKEAGYFGYLPKSLYLFQVNRKPNIANNILKQPESPVNKSNGTDKRDGGFGIIYAEVNRKKDRKIKDEGSEENKQKTRKKPEEDPLVYAEVDKAKKNKNKDKALKEKKKKKNMKKSDFKLEAEGKT